MVEITLRAVVTGLAAPATPAPAFAGLLVTTAGSAIAPVLAAPALVPDPPPVEVSFEQLLGAQHWETDLYGEKIALRISGEWHWAQPRHDVLTTTIRAFPNNHNAFGLQADFAANKGKSLHTLEPINAG